MIVSTIEALKGSVTVIAVAHRVYTLDGADHVLAVSDGRLIPANSSNHQRNG
jgi:ABC-type bacteriocin/lantibiotic exporter with double-glycine peptidase domain